MTLTELVSQILTYLTVFAQILIACLVLSRYLPKKYKREFLEPIHKKSMLFALIVSLAATLGSLFYSEIAGYEPCKLCWYQRIFMYPQPILLGLAIWLKDRAVIKYILILSIIGGLIALYHYLLQLGVVPNGACAVVGYSVSCARRFVMEMGYITIPMMSLTAFGLIATILFTFKEDKKKK